MINFKNNLFFFKLIIKIGSLWKDKQKLVKVETIVNIKVIFGSKTTEMDGGKGR